MERFLTDYVDKKRKDEFGNEFRPPSKKMSTEIVPKMHLALTKIFKNQGFRPYQEDIISAVLNGEDVFVVMPTGGGKSLLFQLPAVLSKGLTIVISPLLSLICEQVTTLIKLGIPSAYLTSTCSEKMKEDVYNDLGRIYQYKEPYLKLLYTTPESIVKSDRMKRTLSAMLERGMLARFVIDEAHCVSSWGHDFRKEYGDLGILKRDYKDIPILALTATARKAVADDVCRTLGK